MSKVAGSYESVVKGVSQQVAQDRRSGQHEDQDNMISDPVRGLARRHGSVMQDEMIVGDYTPTAYSELLADTVQHKVVTFYIDGIEYDLIARTAPDTDGLGQSSFAWVFNKATRQFIPTVYKSGDAVLNTLVAGGVSAATNVGKLLYVAGNTIVPSWTPVPAYDAPTNQSKLAVWIRGGAYSRTFKLILTHVNGSKVEVQYKTVSASYPILLNTSDISTASIDYQKLVNDRVNAYNSEVTKWIGTSAEDITPDNIAAKLVTALGVAGVTGVTRSGGTLFIDNALYDEAASEDGGDGSLVHAVGNELLAADLVSTHHFAGKIVKIRPRKSGGDDSFYLIAEPKAAGDTGTVEVSWKETAGYITKPVDMFCMATVKDGTFYIASSAAGLIALTGEDIPDFKPNVVGDDITAPLPNFFGKTITYLGVFQDRLVIGSGAVVNVSRPGDYLNMFRQSVLTVIDSDPWEGYALGAEEDVIHHGVVYNKQLILYGERFQYIMSGKRSDIAVISKYEQAIDAKPQGAGQFVFYAKYTGLPGYEQSSLHQLQPAQIQDATDSFEITQTLDDYIEGKPVELAVLTTPNTLIFRTDVHRNKVYTYGYLDNSGGSERLVDSWSTWSWDSLVGDIVGLSTGDGDFLVYVIRHGNDMSGNPKSWVACERFVRDSKLSRLPYMDSLRPLVSYEAPVASTYLTSYSLPTGVSVVIANEVVNRFLGTNIGDVAAFKTDYPADIPYMYVGVAYSASVTPTNPFLLDRNRRAILTGRLTVTKFSIAVADTGALTVDVTTTSGTERTADFIGRVLGAPTNILGDQPIVAATVTAWAGKEVREFSYKLSAKSWLPLTITSIEWVGQSFNNTRRV
jgi:hypothetical protein